MKQHDFALIEEGPVYELELVLEAGSISGFFCRSKPEQKQKSDSAKRKNCRFVVSEQAASY